MSTGRDRVPARRSFWVRVPPHMAAGAPRTHAAGPRARRRARRQRESGQAAVELALVLPVVVAVLVLMVQVGLVVRDQVMVVHAAREAVREVAVRDETSKPAPEVARLAAVSATSRALDPARLRLDVTERDGRVEVRAGYRSPIRVPLLKILALDVPLAAFAHAKREND